MSVILAQVTLGAAATQLSTISAPCRQVIVQNNAAHSMRVGDSTVSSTKGVFLSTVAGGGGGSLNFGAMIFYGVNLMDLYVFGTQNDVVDVIYVT